MIRTLACLVALLAAGHGAGAPPLGEYDDISAFRLIETASGAVIVGGDPVRVWRSDDGFDSWAEVEGGDRFPPRAAFYAAEHNGYLVVMGGEVGQRTPFAVCLRSCGAVFCRRRAARPSPTGTCGCRMTDQTGSW
ncbi:MAG: hypothetical protein P4L40_00105 [Terracidiphilus sp.]|nr:hypothetical protein [Terracidiphilus sp.]